MASINLGGWFGDNWLPKSNTNRPSDLPNFAFIGGRNVFFQKRKPAPKLSATAEGTAPPPPGMYSKMLDQFFWEMETRPDHRHTPEVEKILTEDPVFVEKPEATPEEVEENKKWWEELRKSPVVEFLRRAEEVADKVNELEIEKNKHPYKGEDRNLWEKVPHVLGPDERPMPRRAIKTRKEASNKFWDWARQFFLGIWGYRQRPYPPGRPIDIAQAIGYKSLERRYYDFIMRDGFSWYYKDRLGRTRGPLELITLKTAWSAGIIDTNTFVWGEDMDEWVPIGMVYGLQEAIATWEVRLGAAATAFIHKLQNGMSPWTPLKGFEKKTYKQLQEEAVESKRRDMAVLEANDGIWPGVKIPSHALFLWASGPELTTLLEEDNMPNKFISKDLRYRLAQAIPGLRPWEVLSMEQAMDQITYAGKWYREPLGHHTAGPTYIRHWNKDFMRFFKIFYNLTYRVYKKLQQAIPGLDVVMEKVRVDRDKRTAMLKEKRDAVLKARRERLYGRK